MHLGIYEQICFKLGVIIDATEIYILILGWVQESKNLAIDISAIGMLLRIVGVINLRLILCHLINTVGRDPA